HNTASSTIVGVGSDGTVCVRTYAGRSDVVVDIAGWFGPGAGGLRYQSQPATRLLDTRTDVGPSDRERATTISATAVLNAVAVDPNAPGFVAVRPCGQSAISSLINTTPGENNANITAVAPGNGGQVCARSSTVADIVIDQVGLFVP